MAIVQIFFKFQLSVDTFRMILLKLCRRFSGGRMWNITIVLRRPPPKYYIYVPQIVYYCIYVLFLYYFISSPSITVFNHYLILYILLSSTTWIPLTLFRYAFDSYQYGSGLFLTDSCDVMLFSGMWGSFYIECDRRRRISGVYNLFGCRLQGVDGLHHRICLPDVGRSSSDLFTSGQLWDRAQSWFFSSRRTANVPTSLGRFFICPLPSVSGLVRGDLVTALFQFYATRYFFGFSGLRNSQSFKLFRPLIFSKFSK